MDAWREWMDRGFDAFQTGRSREASDAFHRAVELNPASLEAHLYLALAVGQQHVPGDVSIGVDGLISKDVMISGNCWLEGSDTTR